MYPKELYTKVKDDLANLRLTRGRELDQRKAAVYQTNSRIRQIDLALKELYSELGLTIIKSAGDPLLTLKRVEQESKALKDEKNRLLSALDLPEDFMQMQYECLICKDQGVTGTALCQCFLHRLSEYAALDSNLSSIMDTQNFEYFDFSYYSTVVDRQKGFSPRQNIENIFETCVRFVKNFDFNKENLFLFGPTGLGKTFLSSCIAKDLLQRGKSVYYQSAPKIFKILEDYKFGRGNLEKLSLVIDKIYQCDLLIIDDLGTEMSTSFSASALFDIINSRIFGGKKTIINTNVDNNELTQIYSDRVASRLFGHYTQLEFFGKDIRLMRKKVQ